MDLRDVRFRTGVSEKTVRKWIKDGKLAATMVTTEHGRRGDVDEEALTEVGAEADGTLPEGSVSWEL